MLIYTALHNCIVEHCTQLLLYSLPREEVLWLYQQGASYIFPERWERFIAPIPVVERGDMISAYYRRLIGDNEEVKKYYFQAIKPLYLIFHTSSN